MSQPHPKSGPLHITDEHIVDHLSHLAPQIHLTLTSVLQGLALIFLITSIKLPSSFEWPAIQSSLIIHHFYLPHIVSFMVIIITWNEFTYVIFFLHWPLTTSSTILQFLLALAESVTFASVDSLGRWLFWLGILNLLGAITRTRNRNFASKDLYLLPQETTWSKPFKRWTLDTVWQYWILIILCPIGIARDLGEFGLNTSFMVGNDQLVLFDFLCPAILAFVGVFIMYTDDWFYTSYTEDVLLRYHSIYSVTRHGVVNVRPQPPIPAEPVNVLTGNEKSGSTM